MRKSVHLVGFSHVPLIGSIHIWPSSLPGIEFGVSFFWSEIGHGRADVPNASAMMVLHFCHCCTSLGIEIKKYRPRCRCRHRCKCKCRRRCRCSYRCRCICRRRCKCRCRRNVDVDVGVNVNADLAIPQLPYKFCKSCYLLSMNYDYISANSNIFQKTLELDHSCRNSLLYLSKRSGNIKEEPTTWVFWRGKESRFHVWNDITKLWRKYGLQNVKPSGW
jgi:hypothetical protein